MSGIGVAISFSAERWAQQARTMIDELGVQTKDFLNAELPLLIEKIVEFTPPGNRQEGTVRTRADYYKSVKPFDVEKFHNERVAAIVEKQDYAAFDAVMQNAPSDAMRGARGVKFSPELHENARDNRGRVRGSSLKVFVLGSADTKALKEDVANKVANVGIARSGWLAALAAVGGVSAVTSLARWNTRHGSEFGSYESHLDDPERPSITAINSTPWANRQDEGQRIIRNAMDSRVVAMQSRMKFLVRYVRERAGLAAA